jgi:glycosyltransferase involved in cell wall biosynthesis
LKTIDNLVDEISKYKKYELKDLPTNGLTFSVKETDFDKEKVSEYAQASKESNNNFPPVIVDPDHMRIIDGNHRVKGLIEIGQQTVPAYVGIKNDEPKGDKDIYNKEDDIKYENVGTGSFMGTSGEPGSGYAGGGAIMPGKNIDLSKKTSWDKYKKRKPRKFKAIVSPTKYGTFRDKSADNTATKITNIMNSKNENKRVSSMIMKEQIPPNIARLIDDEYHELIKNNFTSTCAIDKLAKDYKVNRQEIIDIIGLNNVKEELNPEEEYKKMEEQDTVEIAIFPGKFKYPHRGHWKMIELASKENDLVYVVISPKEVDGITAQMSKEIFDIYKKYLAKDNVIIEVAEISPVKSVYDFIESINKMGGKNKFILNTYASTEDKSRYENFINKKDKYTYNFVSVNILDLPRFDEIRATNNRIALQNEDWDKVSQSLPQELSKEDKEKVLNILRGK